jgi:sec-independent protein translocase protein TatA
MGIGMRELVIILLVVLVVFGAKKLRTVGSDLGHAVRGFKKAMSEGEDEQSAPKQIRSEGTDAEFSEVAKKSDTASKNERST